MSGNKVFYFGLDNVSSSLISKFMNQNDKIELIKLDNFEDVKKNVVDCLILDSNTSAEQLANYLLKLDVSLFLTTNLLWIISTPEQENDFDISKVSSSFKEIKFLSKDLSLIMKALLFYDFVNKDKSKDFNQDEFYVPLNLSYLITISQAPCDIFVRLTDRKYVKIINGGDDFQVNEIIQKYASKNIEELYIHFKNIISFKDIILKNVFTFDEARDNKVNHHIQVTEAVLNIAYDFGVNDFLVQGINETFLNIEEKFNNKKNMKNFLEIIDSLHGSIIGNHSYLTAIFVSMISKKNNWVTQEIKANLIMASLLHDLDIHNSGFDLYDFKKIAKINALSVHNRNLIKNHAHHLAKKLSTYDVIPTNVINIIAKHHEGAGNNSYPQGLSAPQLSPLNCLFNTAHQFTIELANLAFNYDKVDEAIAKVREHYPSNSFKSFIDILEKEIKY